MQEKMVVTPKNKKMRVCSLMNYGGVGCPT
jgi:hypothetical protein